MRKAYKIILEKIDEGYNVIIPDFHGAITHGKDMADAIYMARDAIGAMGLGFQDLGKDIPEPDFTKYEKKKGEIETYVDIDFSVYRKKLDNKKVKKTLTIPSWLNEKAESEHINFSRVLEEALLERFEMESR